MSLLVTSIAVEKLADLQQRAEAAWVGGSGAVEVRIDTFEDDPAKLGAYLAENAEHTWIITCRSAEEGGHFRGDTRGRVSRLIAAARGTSAYVDFELADWRRSSNIRQKVHLAAGTGDDSRSRLLLSAHDFQGVPVALEDLMKEALNTSGVRAAKVAYRAGDIDDSFPALDLMHRYGPAAVAVAMGEDGLWSRVLAKKLGAFATYCTLDEASATAPGQLTLGEMVERYRWPQIDKSTRVFGVLGDPVAHSMSPLLFNRWFAEVDVNAVYLPLRVRGGEDGLKRFLHGCMERPWLDLGGFSVTLPHKSAALCWLGDAVDPSVKAIGALNTLAIRGGKVTGHNTDARAAIESMIRALGCSREELAGLSVDVLGAGGVARAVLAGLGEVGCAVTVYGRSPERTSDVAAGFDCRAAAWEDRINRSGKVLINCTSIGMWPDVEASPMPPGALAGNRLVFDVVYNPAQTRLLKEAVEVEAIPLGGLDMFVRQAAMQFELWTGQVPDTTEALDLVARELRRRMESQP